MLLYKGARRRKNPKRVFQVAKKTKQDSKKVKRKGKKSGNFFNEMKNQKGVRKQIFSSQAQA